MAKNECDGRRLKADIDTHQNRPRSGNAEMGFQVLRYVRSQDGYPVAGIHPSLDQRLSQSATAFVELSVGIFSIPVDNGSALRIDNCGTLQKRDRRERYVIGVVWQQRGIKTRGRSCDTQLVNLHLASCLASFFVALRWCIPLAASVLNWVGYLRKNADLRVPSRLICRRENGALGAGLW
ncbi:hypothetical protein D9M68_740140 [compost metagenome]